MTLLCLSSTIRNQAKHHFAASNLFSLSLELQIPSGNQHPKTHNPFTEMFSASILFFCSVCCVLFRGGVRFGSPLLPLSPLHAVWPLPVLCWGILGNSCADVGLTRWSGSAVELAAPLGRWGKEQIQKMSTYAHRELLGDWWRMSLWKFGILARCCCYAASFTSTLPKEL